jgi:hypothetical protein
MKGINRLAGLLVSTALSGACAPESSHLTGAQVTSTTGGSSATGGVATTGGGNEAIEFDAGRPGCTTIADHSTGNIVIKCLAPFRDEWAFVHHVGAVTDSVTTATLNNPQPGTLCMSGVLANAGPNGANWGAILGMDFIEWNEDETEILKWLDAQAFGITQLKFTLESPPPGIGVGLGLDMVTHTECAVSPGYCSSGGRLRLMTGDTPFAYLTPGDKGPLPISAFVQPPWETSTLTLDTSKLLSLGFVLGSNSGEALSYEFCISNLRFLDANGNEVVDPRLADSGA